MAADPQTVGCWEIADRLGMPVPEELKAAEAIRDELRPHVVSAVQYLQIAGLVSKWVKTRNPHYMDFALILLSAWDLPITETVSCQLAKVAQLRVTGGAMGTADKIRKEASLENALMLMANMRHAVGLSIPRAAGKAAAVYKSHRASTLEKYYEDRMLPSREAELWENWRRNCPDHAEQWKPIIEQLPDTCEHDHGNRR